MEIETEANAIDVPAWEKGSHGRRFTHDMFRFPGKFHPPIVENLIRRYSPRVILDPMAGVGTVAVEAKAAGVPSIAIDVDPVSTFFANVKTRPIGRPTLLRAWGDLQRVMEGFRRPRWQRKRFRFGDLASSTLQRRLGRVGAAQFGGLAYWFRNYVLVDYALINHSIWNGGLPNRSTEVREFFKACLLSTVRRISNADPAPVSGLEITRHMRDRIARGYEIDVLVEFQRRVETNIGRMHEYDSYLRDHGTRETPAIVVRGSCKSARNVVAQAGMRPDLILFSPPYCNAIEYWRRHQLEYFLGGFLRREDVPVHNASFIGRRRLGRTSTERPEALNSPLADEVIGFLHQAGRRVKAWQLWNYFSDMRDCLRGCFGVLLSGGRVVVVVGDSRTYLREVPTAAILQDIAERCGFESESVSRYAIKNRSMQYPLRAGESKIAEEAIIVLRKTRDGRRWPVKGVGTSERVSVTVCGGSNNQGEVLP